MAKGEYVLNVGDDNVVLTRFVDKKVANAWLGSPDPAMAQEELAEALAEDPKARISILIDTLDQSFKEEEIPRVGVLDRRKVLARHINMAFPGANLRGARLVQETAKKTLIYEFASVPLDGRIPGWIDFVASLPNEKGDITGIATENVDILRALAPKDALGEEGKNHWRHMIGVNVTGGLRQIIEKNGRLCLTRLTQAPPPETPPAEFADMIVRDFKATITYIRRLGYQVGEPLDLVVLTTSENKAMLEELTWDGARSVTVYTPYEAGLVLGLGSLGREDQEYCDVLHAAWFASKRKSALPLTKAAALGDARDDLRELAFLVAPYAAGLATAAVIGWTGWIGYSLHEFSDHNSDLQAQLASKKASLTQEQAVVAAQPYDAARVRNIIDVATALDASKIDIIPALGILATAVGSDAVVLQLEFNQGKGPVRSTSRGAAPAASPSALYTFEIRIRLAQVISTAAEAVQVARRVNERLVSSFGKGYTVTMTAEPVGAQDDKNLTGTLSALSDVGAGVSTRETFYAAYRIERMTP